MKISDSSGLAKIAEVRFTNEKVRKQQSPVGTLVGRTAAKGGAVRISLAATACLRLAATLALAPWWEWHVIKLELERFDIPTCLRTSLLDRFTTFSVLVFLLLLFSGGHPLPFVPRHLKERTFRIITRKAFQEQALLQRSQTTLISTKDKDNRGLLQKLLSFCYQKPNQIPIEGTVSNPEFEPAKPNI